MQDNQKSKGLLLAISVLCLCAVILLLYHNQKGKNDFVSESKIDQNFRPFNTWLILPNQDIIDDLSTKIDFRKFPLDLNNISDIGNINISLNNTDDFFEINETLVFPNNGTSGIHQMELFTKLTDSLNFYLCASVANASSGNIQQSLLSMHRSLEIIATLRKFPSPMATSFAATIAIKKFNKILLLVISKYPEEMKSISNLENFEQVSHNTIGSDFSHFLSTMITGATKGNSAFDKNEKRYNGDLHATFTRSVQEISRYGVICDGFYMDDVKARDFVKILDSENSYSIGLSSHFILYIDAMINKLLMNAVFEFLPQCELDRIDISTITEKLVIRGFDRADVEALDFLIGDDKMTISYSLSDGAFAKWSEKITERVPINDIQLIELSIHK